VITGGEAAIPRTAPDHIVVAGTLASGAVASVHLLSGVACRISGTHWEINGTEGDLLLTSTGAANINRALFQLQGGRGETMDSMPIPAGYRLTPDGLADGAPPTALAHLYRDFAEAIATGRTVELDFRYALRIHEMLDSLQIASDSGQRQHVRGR
jgi:predicted dehydrogenase